jgi:glycosyltransferase involved in cell wall biosynthesis
MVSYHRWRHTWDSVVDTYLVSTEFYRRKFIEGGLPAEKLAFKPLFVTPDPQPRQAGPSSYALYVGRLDQEKGIPVLLQAWQNLAVPLKIRGNGNLLSDVQHAARSSMRIELVDRLSRSELFDLFKGARFLVWPSQGFYETFGMVAIEAYACGVPVLGSRTGVAEEIVLDQQTGLHFEPENPADLTAKAQWAWDHPEEMTRMGQRARQEFEAKYSAQQNYARLMVLYQQTIEKYRAAH